MRRIVLSILSAVVVLTILLTFKSQVMNSSSPAALDQPLNTTRPEDTPTARAEPSSSPTPSASKEPRPTAPTTAPTPSASPTLRATPHASVRPTATPRTRSTPRPTKTPAKTPTKTPAKTPTSTPTEPSTGPRGYNGSTVSTIYGNVQIRITVDSGRITGVSILQIPDQDDVDRDVNDMAVPRLVSQTLARQSANLDVVSGATYTSNAYMRSLQAAIDAAGL